MNSKSSSAGKSSSVHHAQSFTFLTLFCLLFTACAAQSTTAPSLTIAPPPSATSLPSPSPLPSPTLQPSPTPPPSPTPTPHGPLAVIAEVINAVEAHQQASETWQPALVNAILYLGGEVWAKEASTARLNIHDQLVRVAPNTIFTFTQPDDNTLKINLQQGQMWLNVEGLSANQELQVETPGAAAAVRGTRFSVRVDADGRTVVSCVNGQVDVTAEGQTVLLEPGFQTQVVRFQPPEPAIPLSIQEQMLWGMAAGPDLQIVLPTSSHIQQITQPAKLNEASWSHDGSLFAYVLHSTHLGYKPHFFDLQSGKHIPSPLPGDNWGVAFNPAGPGLGYDHVTSRGLQICILPDLSIFGQALAAANPSSSRPVSLRPSWPLAENTPACIGGDGYAYGFPWWSPDGQFIAFYTNNPGKFSSTGAALLSWTEGIQLTSPWASILPQQMAEMNIYTMRPDATQVTKLTSDRYTFNHRPLWSPDSKQIAYVSAKSYGAKGDAWVMNADGSDARMIFAGVMGNAFCRMAWSHDGQWIALPSDADGRLWLVHPDGSEAHPLAAESPGEGVYNAISWSPSPSGWPLLFQFETEAGIATYYIINEDAPAQLLLPTNWGPIWSPTGDSLAVGLNTNMDNQLQGQAFLFSVINQLWP